MAYESESVWAIDLGNNSLKALHLTVVNDVIQVQGFDVIRHGKILAGSGIGAAERDELIALSLRQLGERHPELYESEVIISVPSQNSFARFVTLPPVEKRKIPEIVRFEAVQQIPFDINEVQWSYQMMSGDDEPERKVGIFAIKNEVVNAAMEPFENEDIGVSYVQMTPMALYNYLLHDRPDLMGSAQRAVVLLNVGAENTDLVVCTPAGVWQRCILIGGNAFTRAIADTFKLNFMKAEKLKRTAPVSKYARQIFQAMRPVFTDLASEVQRSLGFYTSSNANVKLTRVIAMGGGTKLRGLLKYLQQTLQIPVERPDSFKRLSLAPTVPAAKFTANVADFGVVYGLGVQALGYGEINSNLLPSAVARSLAWAGKSRWLTIAASVLLVASVAALGRTILDGVLYRGNKPLRQDINRVITRANEAANNLEQQQQRGVASQAIIEKHMKPFQYRDTIPKVQQLLLSVLPNEKNNSAQAGLYQAFAKGDIGAVMRIPRKERKQLFVTGISIYYSDDLPSARFGNTALQRMGSATQRVGEAETQYEDEYLMMMEEEMARVYGAQYSPVGGMGGVAGAEKTQGFVVTISGYSPYKTIGELVHPDNVERDPARWGLMTRLLHLDDTVRDGNSPFAVYDVTNPEQFKAEFGAVDLDAQMPMGIGVVEERPIPGGQAVRVLLDPMTKEIISKTAQLDASGREVVNPRTGERLLQENDHWFILNFKLEWRDAPAAAASGGMGGGPGMGGPPPAPPRGSPTSTSSRKSSGGSDMFE